MDKTVKLVSGLYKEYSDYVNKNKMLPNIIDGLLPVQRRILLTLHLIARNEYVKTAKVLGENMSRFHPHSTADGTAAWSVKNEFAIGDGQWGTSIGTESIGPAASRYTKMKSDPKTEEIAFKYINFVDWEEGELDPEPKTIPTMFPFCLMGKEDISSIAFGFKTEIPVYTKKDLQARLEYLNGWRKNEPVIYPNIIGCEILSDKKTVKELLTKGYGKLNIQGKYRIDEINKCIYVNGWSPRIKEFEVILNKINKGKNLLSNGDIGYIDESNKDTGTQVKFEVSKLRNTGTIFEEMKKIIPEALKANISYSIYTVDEKGNIKLASVDEMLTKCFNFYKKTFLRFCDESIEKNENTIEELKAIDKIKPHISSINGKKNLEDSVKELSKKSGVSVEVVNSIITKYKIQKLISTNTDIKEIEEKIKNFKKDIKNVDEVCQENYKNII